MLGPWQSVWMIRNTIPSPATITAEGPKCTAPHISLSEEHTCIDGGCWFSTVQVHFNNEVYLPCTTAVHQPLHFLHDWVPHFIYKDIQYLPLTVKPSHNALSAFRPEKVIAYCKKQIKFAQKLLKTFYCTSLPIRRATKNLLMWTNVTSSVHRQSDNLTAAWKIAFIETAEKEDTYRNFVFRLVVSFT